MSSLPGLTTYAINRHVDCQPVTGFDDFVSQTRLQEASGVGTSGLSPVRTRNWLRDCTRVEYNSARPCGSGSSERGVGADLLQQ